MALKYDDFLTNSNEFEYERIGYKDDSIFSFDKIEDIKYIIDSCNLKILKFIGTDGISRFLNGNINNMSESSFEKYLNHIENISEDESIIGMSEHALDICNII